MKICPNIIKSESADSFYLFINKVELELCGTRILHGGS